MGRTPANQEIQQAPSKPCPPARLRFFLLLFWADFFLPKALLGAGASVSRSVSPRQWALSADNGQREECRRRAGLEEGQSAFRRQWPSGCCREGPAVTRAASSKAPFIGPAAPEEWPLGPRGAGGPRLPGPPLQAEPRPPALSAPRGACGHGPHYADFV